MYFLVNESGTSIERKMLSIADFPEQLLEHIDNNGYDLVCLSERSGRIIYVSKSVEKVLGITKDQAVGKLAFRFILRDDWYHITSNIDPNSKETQKFFLHLRNEHGRYVIFETSVLFLEWNGRQCILAIAKDISDKKQAEEMLIRSEKMSIAGQLAAGIAHEIRNPLTSLKGFIQLLQAGINDKDAYYKIMMEELEKINTITSELLFISKPMTDEKDEESLSIMLDDVVTLLNTQANLYNIDIQLDVLEDVMVYCDKSQLKQVFINLIKNAIEEMDNGGKIEIVVEATNHSSFIHIKDEGPGIPHHLIHKLKEPFFTTKKNGTGLGLMISNQIIESHRGHLSIQSEIGKGSIFTIELPIYR